MCSRGLRKFSNSGMNLTCFESIPYFSRHDVNTYSHCMTKMRNQYGGFFPDPDKMRN